jgi:hypothetical protein
MLATGRLAETVLTNDSGATSHIARNYAWIEQVMKPIFSVPQGSRSASRKRAGAANESYYLNDH